MPSQNPSDFSTSLPATSTGSEVLIASRRTMLASLAVLLPVLGTPLLLGACSALGALNVTVPSDTYRLATGIAYGPEARQQLDVYQPLSVFQARAAAAPMVVFFYGGSWSMGDRAGYRFVGEALAAAGIVAVVADYRLSPQVRYPMFVEDSAKAVRWAFDNANLYGADSKRIFVMGHSAGAYNAAMLALDKRWLDAVGLSPRQLKGWIGLAGPYDFLPISDKLTQTAFNWPNTPADSQPIVHASSASPAALLLAPSNDRVVSTQRSTVAMANRLRSSGVRVESELFDSVGHASLIATLAGVLRSRAPVLERITQFVKSA